MHSWKRQSTSRRTRCSSYEYFVEKKPTTNVSFLSRMTFVVVALLCFQSTYSSSNDHHGDNNDENNNNYLQPNRSTTVVSVSTLQSEMNIAVDIKHDDSPQLLLQYSNSSSSSSSTHRNLLTIPQTIIFYAIGDVPYNKKQANRLKGQMSNVPRDAEFVIHVGDIRENNKTNELCFRNEYTSVSDILRLSHAPVFIVPGDNEWDDCSNRNQGRNWWTNVFLNFNNRYWSSSSSKFGVGRKIGRPENFHFTYKNILFMGINIVGGPVPRPKKDWDNQLIEEFNWVKSLILSYVSNIQKSSGRQDIVGRIVLFGHANPQPIHTAFFRPFANFVKNDLKNKIPILYLHGDLHDWVYDPQFMQQSSILRISLAGLGRDPPLKVTVHATGKSISKLSEAFSYDRSL